MAVSNNPSHGTKPEGTLGRAATETKEKVQTLADKAQDAAANVGDKAKGAATAVKQQADETFATVGHKMTSLADNIRANAPSEGVLGNAATSVADNLRSGGRYLEQHGLESMGRDLTNVVRQNPMQSLLIGFGIGCLLGMSLGRR